MPRPVRVECYGRRRTLIRTFDPILNIFAWRNASASSCAVTSAYSFSQSGKRFVNVYRLVRTSVGEKELRAFVNEDEGGEYRRSVIAGYQTGYPEQAMQITQDLISGNKQNVGGSSFIRMTPAQCSNAMMLLIQIGDRTRELRALAYRSAWRQNGGGALQRLDLLRKIL